MADDTSGNTLGPRGTFIYTSDTGVSYNARLDLTVATAAGNVESTNANLPVLCPSKFLEPRLATRQTVFLHRTPHRL